MDINYYMLNQRNKIFPEFLTMDDHEVQDFCEKTAEKHPKDLSYRDWFWLHPTAYSFLHYGVSIMAIIIFGISSLLLYLNNHHLSAGITTFMFIAAVYDLFKKIKNKAVKGTTFYKLWLI